MPLQPVTRDFLALVERETGYPVHAFATPELQSLAQVHPARGNVPAHIVKYKPTQDETVDYVICYQCGFLLRQFENPPERRVDLVGSAAGRAETLRDLTGPQSALAHFDLPPAQVEHMADMFFDGLVTHLRSIPVGLRVAEWLSANYPALRAGQRTTVLKEIADARATLVPQYREMTPERVFKASHAINAAYGQYWAAAYQQRELATPWQFAGFDRAGRALLDLWRAISAEPAQDRALIEAWAETLGIPHWLQWVPYVAP